MPAGSSTTLTVLFTDIEGSTSLWDADEAAMRSAHEQHNRILFEAFEAHGGSVVKNRGDGFMVVFPDPVRALEATVAGQRGLHEAQWPEETGPLKMRAALSTGVAEARDGDYYGTSVNRGARLESMAHGGQILVAESTRALVVDLLPADLDLVDLGRHRLRGIAREERVFQVAAPGLPDGFPPLGASSRRGNRLPTPSGAFFGRDAIVADIRGLLDNGARLVTLLGPGGIGKTRLAVEVARGLESGLSGGAFFADLSSVESVDAVAAALVEAVGAHHEGSADPIDLIADAIDGPALLVVDGFDRTAAAATIARILERCPDLTIIATSHRPLGIDAERISRVPPLSVSDGDGVSPAVALFYDRAAAQGVALSDDDLAAVDSICRRLDGLPLAIELVAARTRLLGVSELDQMLAGSLDAIGSASTDTLGGKRTLRGTIDLSLHDLTDAQRALFTRLSAMPAGATLDLATWISGAGGSVLDDIAALVDNSLVNAVTGLPGGTRFRQLAPLREYGSELLAEEGATGATLDRLVEYYITESPRLRRSLEIRAETEHQLKADHPNLIKAMERSVDVDRYEEMAVVLMDLWIYWFNGDRVGTLADWLQSVGASSPTASLAWLKGLVAMQQGDYENAGPLFAAALEMFRESGYDRGEALAAVFLATTLEDPEEARARLHFARERFVERDEPMGTFLTSLFESGVDAAEGDVEASLATRLEGLAMAETHEYPVLVAWMHWNLGITYTALGRLGHATASLQEALDYMVSDGYQEGIASCALSLGTVEVELGRPEDGMRLIAASNAIFDRIGAHVWMEAAGQSEAATEKARHALGASEVDRIAAEGAALSLSDVVDLAYRAIARQVEGEAVE